MHLWKSPDHPIWAYPKTKTNLLFPFAERADFLTFLLKYTLSCILFRDRTRPRFSKYKKHGHYPCPYAPTPLSRQARLKVYPQNKETVSSQT